MRSAATGPTLALAVVLTSSLLQAGDRSPPRILSAATARPIAPFKSNSAVTARWADSKQTAAKTKTTRTRSFQARAGRTNQTAPPLSRVVRIPSIAVPGGPTVRLTSQLEPLDPFDDPFGDRSTGQRQVELPSPTLHPITSQPTGDNGPGQPFEEIEDPLRSAPAPPADNSPREQPGAEPAPLPPPPSSSEDTDQDPAEPCNRIYNERDCCAEDDACRIAREGVYKSIRDISVDITPQLTLAKLATEDEDNGTYEQELELSLAESPSRIWRNTRGETLADGRLVDFRDGQVVVEQANGDTVRIPFGALSDDDSCFVTAWWSIPTECRLERDEYAGRNWIATTLTWKASALCHKPLYFENVQLERYGHTAGPLVQPVLSGAHFFLNIAALPYNMGIHPPNECHYALGYYRPGNCAPWLMPPIPLSIRGALLQAGAITGGILVIP